MPEILGSGKCEIFFRKDLQLIIFHALNKNHINWETNGTVYFWNSTIPLGTCRKFFLAARLIHFFSSTVSSRLTQSFNWVVHWQTRSEQREHHILLSFFPVLPKGSVFLLFSPLPLFALVDFGARRERKAARRKRSSISVHFLSISVPENGRRWVS